MALPKHKPQRERKLKAPKVNEPDPLTQDWADALYTLLLAAGIAEEIGQKDIKATCLLEVRRILRRGGQMVEEPKTPNGAPPGLMS